MGHLHHEEEQFHEHEHDADHHEHHHDHDHHHEHEHHDHDLGELSESEKARMLLAHMLGHNEHHLEELKELGEQLLSLQKKEASLLVKEACEKLDESNQTLKKALELLEG